jgi:hypothetical protein
MNSGKDTIYFYLKFSPAIPAPVGGYFWFDSGVEHAKAYGAKTQADFDAITTKGDYNS